MLKKKMVSVLLALSMCLSLAAPAVAVGEEEFSDKITGVNVEGYATSATECTHPNKKFLTSGNTYESLMSQGHYKVSYVKYHCPDCKQILGPEVTSRNLESHTLKRQSFTGNDYHKGNTTIHMAEYQYSCSYCDYYTTRWESYTCLRGNGGVCDAPPLKWEDLI